jgi:hypothetical protein
VRDRSIAIGAVVVFVVVVAGVIFAGAFGSGTGAGGGGDAGAAAADDSFPTETPSTSESGAGADDGSSDAGTTDAEAGPSFAFAIDRIESCGETCRDVTTTLTSEDAGSTDVTVYTRIYVGNGTDGDVAWQGSEPVGDLDANESYTGTERVDLSITDAYAIQQAGGWITVRTTIESGEKTVTTTERRQVA